MTLEPSAIALSVGAGAAAGLVGCFAVMRRMTLAADAISHIALPGIGVAILLRVHPILGTGRRSSGSAGHCAGLAPAA